MNIRFGMRKRIAVAATSGVIALPAGLLPSTHSTSARAAAESNSYHQTNLVSDQPGVALIQDPDLVNPWGISMSGTSPFWVANNVSGTATLYAGDVNGSPFVKNSLVVSIPGGFPTGTVFKSTADFSVSAGGGTARLFFIFASQVGIVSGWNAGVPPPPTSTHAQIGGTSDAVYTGLAIGQVGTSNYLYAADFEHGHIDVYDKTFQIVDSLDGTFSDPNIPNSYSPFNIQNLGGKLYVTYAQQSHKEPDEETDHGSGFVDVFSTSGHLLQRLIRGNHLSAPWGIALAPGNFGPFSDALLVGNFGNGHIQAFDPTNGKFLGQ